MLDGATRPLLLELVLEEELVDRARSQALGQIVKGAVLVAAVVAMAVGFAAAEKRSTKEARRESGWILSCESRNRLRWRKASVDLAVSYILAIYKDRIRKTSPESTNKKIGGRMRKCSCP